MWVTGIQTLSDFFSSRGPGLLATGAGEKTNKVFGPATRVWLVAQGRMAGLQRAGDEITLQDWCRKKRE